MAGVFVAQNFPTAALPYAWMFASAGVVLFVAGLLLRWWAIIVLGRFFTVDVSIAEGHELIESGPYRFIRHPSYTGALLAFLGFARTVAVSNSRLPEFAHHSLGIDSIRPDAQRRGRLADLRSHR